MRFFSPTRIWNMVPWNQKPVRYQWAMLAPCLKLEMSTGPEEFLMEPCPVTVQHLDNLLELIIGSALLSGSKLGIIPHPVVRLIADLPNLRRQHQ